MTIRIDASAVRRTAFSKNVNGFDRFLVRILSMMDIKIMVNAKMRIQITTNSKTGKFWFKRPFVNSRITNGSTRTRLRIISDPTLR
jgi:hypothetical protein